MVTRRGPTGPKSAQAAMADKQPKDIASREGLMGGCRGGAAYRIVFKLGATRSPAQGWWTSVRARPGHNTPLPLERSPPASFKRLLGSTFPEPSLGIVPR